MAKRPDTKETVLLAIELLRRIPRSHKVTASQLHHQLQGEGIERDLRTIQRQLEMLSEHFDIERDVKNRPYGYRWKEQATGFAITNLTSKESLLLSLAAEQLRNFLPPKLMKSMDGFFDQARRNLSGNSNLKLEREWAKKVRVVATSQPLLAPKISPEILEVVSEALYNNRWLTVDYQNSSGKRKTADVMPLGLAQQGPRLYLVCQYRGYDDQRSLALHRILEAKASTLGFERPTDFDLKKYDDDGRFGFGEGKKIRLSFEIHKHAGSHLLETPLSLDQTVQDLGNDVLKVTATVVESAMLERWLLGFGDAVAKVRRRGVSKKSP